MKKKFLTAAAIVTAATVYLIVSPPAVISDVRAITRHGPLATALAANDLCYGVLLQGRSEEDVRAGERILPEGWVGFMTAPTRMATEG